MSLDVFSNPISQSHGINRSMAESVISSIIAHLTQQQGGDGSGIGRLFSQGNNYLDDDRTVIIQPALSNLMGQRDSEQLNRDHSLVRYVQQQEPTRSKQERSVHSSCDRFNERTCE